MKDYTAGGDERIGKIEDDGKIYHRSELNVTVEVGECLIVDSDFHFVNFKFIIEFTFRDPLNKINQTIRNSIKHLDCR